MIKQHKLNNEHLQFRRSDRKRPIQQTKYQLFGGEFKRLAAFVFRSGDSVMLFNVAGHRHHRIQLVVTWQHQHLATTVSECASRSKQSQTIRRHMTSAPDHVTSNKLS